MGIFVEFLWTRRKKMGQSLAEEGAQGGHPLPGRARGPWRGLVEGGHLGCPPNWLSSLKIPKYLENPRGVDEKYIQPSQVPEPRDPI